MRGRLVHPFIAELAQLTTEGTAGDPDGAGPLVEGYDPDFHEPVVVTDAAGARMSARREREPFLRLPCQFEPGAFEALTQLANGDSPDSRIVLVFHFADLERLGLVDPVTGEAMIRKNDRLHAIYERCSDRLVQQVRNPPGLYATQTMPASFGLGRMRNLLLVTFEDREVGVRS